MQPEIRLGAVRAAVREECLAQAVVVAALVSQ